MRTLDIGYSAYEADMLALDAGRQMRRNGVPINAKKVWSTYREQHSQANVILRDIQALSPTLNPNSSASLASVLYDQMKLAPPAELPDKTKYTSSGAPSTGKLVLAALVRDLKQSDPDSDEYWLVRNCLRYSKVKKALESIRSYMTGPQIDVLNNALGTKYKCKNLVYPDGRVHGLFNPTTFNGRYAASKPNLQQIFDLLKRFMFLEGYCVVYADYDQIHIRIQANQWEIPRLRHVLTTGEDPHLSTMANLCGLEALQELEGFIDLMNKPEDGTVADNWRQLGKGVNYGAAYGAGAAVLYAQLLARIKDGEPELSWVTQDMLVNLLQLRRQNEPEWARHYERVSLRHATYGYLESEGTKRRFECRGGKPTDLYNCTVLGFEADLVGHVTREVAKRWPTELIVQAHDSIALLVPEDQAEQRAIELGEHMSVMYKNHPIPYTAKGGIYNSLSTKDVRELAAA